jgi:hypothetical protein
MADAATQPTFRTLPGRPGRVRAVDVASCQAVARRARSTTRRLAQATPPGQRHRAAAETTIQSPERRCAAASTI